MPYVKKLLKNVATRHSVISGINVKDDCSQVLLLFKTNACLSVRLVMNWSTVNRTMKFPKTTLHVCKNVVVF